MTTHTVKLSAFEAVQVEPLSQGCIALRMVVGGVPMVSKIIGDDKATALRDALTLAIEQAGARA